MHAYSGCDTNNIWKTIFSLQPLTDLKSRKHQFVLVCVSELEMDRRSPIRRQSEIKRHLDRWELECVLSVELLSVKQSNLEAITAARDFCLVFKRDTRRGKGGIVKQPLPNLWWKIVKMLNWSSENHIFKMIWFNLDLPFRVFLVNWKIKSFLWVVE